MNDDKKNSWELTVPSTDAGIRLDKFWGRELKDEGVSRGRVKSWIESGLALVNGEPVTKGKHKLASFDKVAIGAAENEASEDAAQPMEGDLDIVYEDDHVVVVDKAAGLTTHPAPGEPGPTLVNHLLHKYPDISSKHSGMDSLRPGIVHRLDKDTSGLIAAVRTEADRLTLASDFAERRVRKVYLAIVHGKPEKESGTIEAPIGRHPQQKTRMAVLEKGGREAKSDYRVLWTGPRGLASLVAVRIHTGRTHQIRVHMAHIGHPLLGDAVYGSREHAEWCRRSDRIAELAPRQMLHAFYLSFNHPENGENITLWRQPSKDFLTLLAGLNRECLRVGIVGMPGSGKSTVLRHLREEGLPCFSADECVAELYASDGDGAAMIMQRFGGEHSLEDGSVDKASLFKAMCESDGLRREIMDMVHPMVRHACEVFFKAHRDEPVAYAEIPLLLEGGWHEKGHVDAVAGVRCPHEKRTGELREIRGLDESMLAIFDSWQWPEEKKLAACDTFIENCGGLDELAKGTRTMRLWAEARFQADNDAFKLWLEKLWPQLADEFDNEVAK
ncbi:dephospho-CoA kinase [Pseudodesulfovibrio sp. zrk46]|uniref:dephospho-CoA kinase n=1 Tax=Pseudodesulfovibrio sp. zrk46 TaxID=2725288 RepID=UPI0014493881|nr:dephospho-CoA kinase [Pseudodesulfovibrio sp. zrk46]QJB57308.1 dephospho-CoA kinase [Pseudodesulfovibrio sp. zrk46]